MVHYKAEDFNYELPPERIAQFPLEKRDASKMLVVSKSENSISRDYLVSDLPSFLSKGDVLVMNNTKVVSARLLGRKKATGGAAEIFLTEKTSEKNVFNSLVKPSKRIRVNDLIKLDNSDTEILIETRREGSFRTVRFITEKEISWEEIDKIGGTPLPPYIKRKAENSDKERYQTIYAGVPGAVAAPTAGLHITEEILENLEEKGVEAVYLLLHVGPGTFAYLSEDLKKHRMHAEYYELPEIAAEKINTAKKKGGRIFAVGTTTVRVLESCAESRGLVGKSSGWTSIFIYPPYEFKTVDGLLTNFHLPKTSLLCLVSAFAGRENILRSYRKALDSGYRFASYGDAMLILP
ncbi:tRNA preQ1(34) S-adenosylmethionine ribosyltransferase-isomerase QueA [candidate division WOR-3 bacterium]|nr:tRNA preQ1(34) S-adenosylmethionine ribosyltransferase-isomerase QueA [candidate division WOR-3 bacterium]